MTMVSNTNIPRAVLVLSLLLLLSPPLFIHKPHNLVAADMELISRECSEHSHNPATCMTCVLSDPGAGKADKIGIATIVVNCINIHGHNLTVNMKSLVSKTEDQTLKAACQDCISKYFINKHLLAAAQVAFQNHQHKIAGSLMGQILRFSKACGHYIGKHSSQVPVVVTEEIDLYDELCFHSKSIISDLI